MSNDHQQAAQAITPNPDSVTLLDAVKLIQQASGTRKVSQPSPGSKVVSGPTVEGRYIPTLSLDPGNVIAIEGFDSHRGYVQCAVDAFSTIHSALQRLSDARAQVAKDTSKTEANQVLIVAAEAEKLQDRATRAFDSARKRLTDGIAAIETQLSEPLTAKADNSLSAEIRAHCRNLPDDKRRTLVAEAVKAKDLTTLQAILGGKHYLSGLTAETQAHFTRQYRELTAPELVTRLDVMRKAQTLIEQRAGLIFSEVEKALGARWDVIQRLRKTQGNAAQALILINNPVQR